jgi:hypothetical protein
MTSRRLKYPSSSGYCLGQLIIIDDEGRLKHQPGLWSGMPPMDSLATKGSVPLFQQISKSEYFKYLKPKQMMKCSEYRTIIL